MQEGDRRERRQLGHITSHFDASESPAVHLGVAAGCFASSTFVGPTALYLKLFFQDASIKRLKWVLFFQSAVRRSMRGKGAHQLQNRQILREHELLGRIIARFETRCCGKSPLFPACHTLEAAVILD
ncbi:hypothetical protein BKA83DRAFT_690607, partial [Pisolithus microcarpus]